MLCLYCKRRIGLVRRLTDNEYCCTEHRVKMRSRSARALRDVRDLESFEDDEISTVFVKRIDGLGSGKAPQSQSSVTSSLVFGILLIGAVYIGTMGDSDASRADARASASTKTSFTDLRRFIRSQAAVRLNDDFKGGLESWVAPGRQGANGGSHDWSFRDGVVRPGSLRIWKDSITLVDYNFDFVGQIEQKSMSWAYRASDVRNYYASKLLISKPGPLPSVDLVRYAVINGAELNRVRLPLPMTVRPDTLYRIHMVVRGVDFSTTINGQMVDTWSDNRLRSGGIGFFADNGEIALLRHVSLTDRDSILGRVLSFLGMVHPAMFPH